MENGEISESDAEAFARYVDLHNTFSLCIYLWGSTGKLGDVDSDAAHQATARVMEKLGLDGIHLDYNSAQEHEGQFWDQFDYLMELNEADMMKQLPLFVTDPKQY